MNLTVEQLKIIINLLYTGKWGFSLQESEQIISPLINKLSDEIRQKK